MNDDAEHPLLKPAWRCRTCGIAWPCPVAKLRLLGRYRGRPDELVEHLKTLQTEATEDLTRLYGGQTPDGLTERFIGWVKARQPTDSRPGADPSSPGVDRPGRAHPSKDVRVTPVHGRRDGGHRLRRMIS